MPLLDKLGLQPPGNGKTDGNTPPGKDPVKLPGKDADKPPAKRDPKLTVKPQANFEFGTNVDLRALVSREGDGEIKFAPGFDTVRDAKPYKLLVSVGEGKEHTAAGPLPLNFEILRADSQLKVGAFAPLEPDANVDAAVRGVVTRQGDGELTFAPPLASINAAGTHEVSVGVAQGTNHRASAKPVPLSVVVKKRPAQITLSKKAVEENQEEKAKADAGTLRRKALAYLNGGMLQNVNASTGLVKVDVGTATYVPGVHKIEVSLGECATHLASNKESFDFRVLMSAVEANSALNAWIMSEKQLTKDQRQMLKKAQLDVGPTFIQFAKARGFAGPAEVIALAKQTVGAIALPQLTRADMWRLMGYPNITTTGSWIIAKKDKVGDKTIHLTVSGDSIKLPQNLAGDKDALYAEMFNGIEWDMQVHVTLEIGQPTPHVYLGGSVDKKGKEVSTEQINAMKAMLKTFKDDVLDKLDTNRCQLANYRLA